MLQDLLLNHSQIVIGDHIVIVNKWVCVTTIEVRTNPSYYEIGGIDEDGKLLSIVVVSDDKIRVRPCGSSSRLMEPPE